MKSIVFDDFKELCGKRQQQTYDRIVVVLELIYFRRRKIFYNFFY